jgi:hypothetical protein
VVIEFAPPPSFKPPELTDGPCAVHERTVRFFFECDRGTQHYERSLDQTRGGSNGGFWSIKSWSQRHRGQPANVLSASPKPG